MARQVISEFRAKHLLAATLDQSYHGVLLDSEADWRQAAAGLAPAGRYVAKADEGVKGRFKKGLVKLDLGAGQVAAAAQDLFNAGFRYVLVEPFRPHAAGDERYLSVSRTRDGNQIMVNPRGGIDVETAASPMLTAYAHDATGVKRLARALGLDDGALAAILECFDDAYMSFLEINPLVVVAGQPVLLDAAVEVDGEAAPLVAGRWSLADLRRHHQFTPEEAAVAELASRSQSSFRLEVLNPDGQVFLLLSGGGASVTLADEVHNQGFGAVLGNYGEYSGNPTADETYVYTSQILSLLLKSRARPKVLVVAGGVANFTDVRVTFRGVVRALAERQAELAKQGIKVYVRRGGPHEAEGLAHIGEFLRQAGLYGVVAGPEMLLSNIIPAALAGLTTEAR